MRASCVFGKVLTLTVPVDGGPPYHNQRITLLKPMVLEMVSGGLPCYYRSSSNLCFSHGYLDLSGGASDL